MKDKIAEFNKNNDYDILQAKNVFNNSRTQSLSTLVELDMVLQEVINFNNVTVFENLKHIHNSHHHDYGHAIDKFGSDKIFFDASNVKKKESNHPIYQYLKNNYISGNNFRDIEVLSREGLISYSRFSSDILQKEYLEERDLDSNGMIYGKDFIIPFDDIYQPINLKYVTSNISPNDKCVCKRLSFQEYLETIPSSDKTKSYGKVIYKDFV